MRKTFLFLSGLLVFFLTNSLYSQKFVAVTSNDVGKKINLAKDQVLEINLPSQPSTGYGWYVSTIDTNIAVQTGKWEFVSAANSAPGNPGTQITRIKGVSTGTTQITLEYKRPWEKSKSPAQVYNFNVVSAGKYTGSYVPPVYKPVIVTPNTPKTLPSAFTWKPQCTSIKDQAQCGSCWAFAACGVLEADINIMTNTVRDISEQWIINCDFSEGGCTGGWSTSAWDLIKSDGAVYESSLPYADASCFTVPPPYDDTRPCKGACGSYTHHEHFDSYTSVAANNTAIKQAIYDHGPVQVSFHAGDNFQAYNSGIFYGDAGTSLNHAVVLCGWDDNSGTGYWILKNSWGTGWGESGWMRIRYGVSQVESDCHYVTYNGGISCPATYNLTTTISSPVHYQSSNIINASNTVNSGIKVIYDADYRINLTPGFHAVSGTEFHGIIDGCGGN